MSKNCTICGGQLENNYYCETCALIIASVYHKYSTPQIMAMFSNIIGIKITQELTDTMYDTLKDSYEADSLKKEGKLN